MSCVLELLHVGSRLRIHDTFIWLQRPFNVQGPVQASDERALRRAPAARHVVHAAHAGAGRWWAIHSLINNVLTAPQLAANSSPHPRRGGQLLPWSTVEGLKGAPHSRAKNNTRAAGRLRRARAHDRGRC
jgi:hypothetical protein